MILDLEGLGAVLSNNNLIIIYLYTYNKRYLITDLINMSIPTNNRVRLIA